MSYPDRFPYDGFTSNELTQKSEDSPPESALLLVERAAQEAPGDRHRAAADVVFVIDDVELCNTHQPDRVVRVFKSAVNHHLIEIERLGVHARTATVLRERVSFHLIVPMIEAWFFGDSDALDEDPITGAIVEDPGAPAPATRLSARTRAHVMRNL